MFSLLTEDPRFSQRPMVVSKGTDRVFVPLVVSLLLAMASLCEAGLPVQFQTVDQIDLTDGELLALDGDGASLKPAGGKEQKIPRDELLSVVLSSGQEAGQSQVTAEWQIVFANGDRLSAKDISIQDGICRIIKHTPQQELTNASPDAEIPLEFIDRIASTSTAVNTSQTGILRTVEKETDALLLANGDQIDGEFISWMDGQVTMETDGQEISVPDKEVLAIAFNDDLQITAKSDIRHIKIFLHDHSVVTARSLALKNDQFQVQATSEYSLTIEPENVGRIDFYSDRAVPLTTRKWTRFEFQPFLSREEFVGVNQSWSQTPLSTQGISYAYGLGLASRSRITFPISEGDRQFIAVCGIDDSTQGGGSVRFRVLVNGEVAYQSEVIRGDDPAQQLGPISLEGSRELSLEVDYADYGDIQDIANWCRPIIVREFVKPR